MRKFVFIVLWILLIGGTVTVGWLFWSINEGRIGYMPEMEQLSNPVDKFASQVLTYDGKLLGTYSYGATNRIFTEYDSISPYMIQALIATEDERFYDHAGIDFKALIRAVIKRGILNQKSAGGGSTLTQQLAKQLYSERAGSVMERLFQKPIEWMIALKLERCYTKQEIITMYLNYFDFLYNAVGIKTASRTYFSKDPHQLTIEECATLVGMCKNPSYYNPVRMTNRALERRNVVIGQMLRSGFITKIEADSLKTLPLKLNFQRADHKSGSGMYVREHLRRVLMAKKPERRNYEDWQKQKYYEDSVAWETDPLYGWCNKNRNREGRNYNIYTDGLKIYSTIDSRMQRYAEESVVEHVVGYLQPAFDKEQAKNPRKPYYRGLTQKRVDANIERAKRQSERWVAMKAAGHSVDEIEASFKEPIAMSVYSPSGDIDTIMTPLDSLKYYKGFLHSGFMCMDTEMGDVKAYVGDVNFSHFRYDMVSQGRRQVGSTIKPFLYALAMESGYTPTDEAPNEQVTYQVGDKEWTPRNSNRNRYGEMVTLRWGLSQSNNWISAWLMNQLSPELLVSLIHEFGVQNMEIEPAMSLCLGACEISVSEMVSAYSAFPKEGMRRAPRFVTRIEDGEGNVLATFAPSIHHVISKEAAWKMVDLMQGVMNGGTGSRMRFRYNIKAPMGGKTGTTNDNSDGWFVGYTPSLSFGAWVGGDERDIHFSSMAYGQGAASALPVVALFLQKVYANPDLGYDSNEAFKKPDMLSESDWYSEYDVEKEISRDSVPEDIATEDDFFN
ncbi:MAG: transglycosylase domain-containing protein [Bacteroidaceae bacterium]|nr:transglycosylase domain-containing protein [Bacteroidaceae bacterium]